MRTTPAEPTITLTEEIRGLLEKEFLFSFTSQSSRSLALRDGKLVIQDDDGDICFRINTREDLEDAYAEILQCYHWAKDKFPMDEEGYRRILQALRNIK